MKTFFDPIKGLCAAFLSSALIFCLFGELTVRILKSYRIFYNLEMAHYSRALKLNYQNPTLPFFHRPNMRENLMGVEIRTNNLGFRADRDFGGKKAGTYRIAVLGDSFTLGWGVPYEKIYTTLLQEKLNIGSDKNEYLVINLGVGNYNMACYCGMLEEKALQLKPDFVIIGYYVNDAELVTNKASSFFTLLSYSDFLLFLWGKFSPFIYNTPDYAAYYKGLYEPGSKTSLEFEYNLNKLIGLLKHKEIPFLFVLLPDLRTFSPYPFEKIYQQIEEQVKKEGSTLNLLNTFKNQLPETLWVHPTDPHPNAKAHKIIAEEINRYLINYFTWKSKKSEAQTK